MAFQIQGNEKRFLKSDLYFFVLFLLIQFARHSEKYGAARLMKYSDSEKYLTPIDLHVFQLRSVQEDTSLVRQYLHRGTVSI